MSTRGFVRIVRRGFASRGFAALLVLLILSPFTAPFSTCDLAELAGEATSAKGPVSGDTLAQDVAALAAVVPLAGLVALDAHVWTPDVTFATIARPVCLALRL